MKKRRTRILLAGALLLVIPLLATAGILLPRLPFHPRMPAPEETVNSWVWDGARRIPLQELPDGGAELLALIEAHVVLRLESRSSLPGRFVDPFYEISVNAPSGSLRLGFQARPGAAYTEPTGWRGDCTYSAEGTQFLAEYLDRIYGRPAQ